MTMSVKDFTKGRALIAVLCLVAPLALSHPAAAEPVQPVSIQEATRIALPKEHPRGLNRDPVGQPNPLQEPGADAAEPSIWERTLYKTLTYQSGTNIMDLALFTALIGGAAGTGSSFLVVNAVTAAGLYYGFEYGWTSAEDKNSEKTTGDMASKAIVYRVANAGRNLALGFAFGGAAAASTAFMLANTATDTAIYIGNEYLWDMVYPTSVPPKETQLASR